MSKLSSLLWFVSVSDSLEIFLKVFLKFVWNSPEVLHEIFQFFISPKTILWKVLIDSHWAVSLQTVCSVLVRHKQSLRVSGWDRQTATHEFMWFSKWNEILFKGTCNELATLRHPSSAVWCVLQWRIFLRESSPIVLHRVLRESKFWIRMHSQTMLVCIADDDFDFNRIQMNSHKTTWSILDASQQISKLDQLYALITKAASISFHSSVCSVRSPICSSVHSSTLSGSLSLSLFAPPALSL